MTAIDNQQKYWHYITLNGVKRENDCVKWIKSKDGKIYMCKVWEIIILPIIKEWDK